MSATAVISQPDRISDLRHREAVTDAMLKSIDEKLARLTLARRVRANAINKIRLELMQARGAEQVVAEHHEPTE